MLNSYGEKQFRINLGFILFLIVLDWQWHYQTDFAHYGITCLSALATDCYQGWIQRNGFEGFSLFTSTVS